MSLWRHDDVYLCVRSKGRPNFASFAVLSAWSSAWTYTTNIRFELRKMKRLAKSSAKGQTRTLNAWEAICITSVFTGRTFSMNGVNILGGGIFQCLLGNWFRYHHFYASATNRCSVVKVRGLGGLSAPPPAPIWDPYNSMTPLIESIKFYFMPK